MHYAPWGFHNFLKIPVCGTPFSSHHGLLPPGLGLPTKNSCTSPNAGLGLPLSCRLLSLHTFFPLESSRLWPGQHPSTFLSFPIIFSTILSTVKVPTTPSVPWSTFGTKWQHAQRFPPPRRAVRLALLLQFESVSIAILFKTLVKY